MNKTLTVVLALAALHASAQQSPLPTAPPVDEGATTPRIVRGNDKVIGEPSAKGVPEGPATAFRLEDAPAREVVHAILGDLLKADYLVHPPLDGRITIVTQSNVTPDQAVFLLEAALQASGLVMARDARGTYHVGKPEVVRGIVPAVRQVVGGALPPGQGAIVVPLRYIGAAEMASILRTVAPGDSIARVDTLRNLLVLVGTRTQAEGWLSMINTFDVDLLKGMSVGVFPLKYATVREVEAAMLLMTPGAPRPAAAPAGAAQGSQASGVALGESHPLFGAVRILPIERLNSVVVVTPRAAYLEEARRWIEKLDHPGNSASEPRLHVYPVRNGSARHLSEVLNGIFGGQAGTPPASTGVAPGLTRASGSTVGAPAAGGGVNLSAGQGAARAGTPVSAGGVNTIQLSGNVRVVADELSNSILVYGSAAQFERIESALNRLDAPATQVLIEASIVEVTLTDDLNYGLQWTFSDARGPNNRGTGVLSSLDGGVLGGALAGFSYTLRNAAGNVKAVLNALAEKSLVKVISTPSLMVLDNHTASIVVGNQQPIRSTETVTDGGNRTTSIQYKDTGVSLAVTPSVNAGDMVTMQINQAVTDVGAEDSATGQRTFLQRQIGSKVAVRSGETLVLGGLIRDNDTNGSNGVPLLHEVPLLGGLFGTKSRQATRTELLVIITPRVVRSDQDARDVSRELRERMRGLMPVTVPAGEVPATSAGRAQ